MGEIGSGSVDAPAPAATAPTPVQAEADVGRSKERRERNRPNSKVLKNAPHQLPNSVIICRRLPPGMTEESFLEQVAPLPEHDYFYFAKPDPTLAPNLFSRAYINFTNEEDIFIFRDKFDDYIFLDDKGNEYPAIVEYAPFQRILKKRRKKDIKCGTLESDPMYMEFIESLKETENEVREPKMEYSYQPTEDKKEEAVVTPLLDFLASRKRDEKKRREEKQRRRPRNRMHRDDDNYDENKYGRSKDDDKSFVDDKDDDDSPANDDNIEIKETHFQNKGRVKSYKDQRRSEDSRKKNDYNKKERYTAKEFDADGDEGEVDEKPSRKDKRDRQKDSYRDKYRDKDKFYDTKKDKYKDKKSNKPWLHKETEEKDAEKSNNSESKATTSEKPVGVSKGPLSSNNIKPFTQLPQYKKSDLTKVIDEMDANRQKTSEKSDPASESTSKEAENPASKPNKIVAKRKEEKGEPVVLKSIKSIDKDNEKSEKQRRNSLESKQKDSSADENTLRRNKSLDDKSQDSNTGDERGKSDKYKDGGIDPRSERRIRNKDRPSLVIYQPGMGKFSKNRIDREKETTSKTIDANKVGSSSNGSSNSVNSQQDMTVDD